MSQYDLFADAPLVGASAAMSECRRYRYDLRRNWAYGRRAVFVMLNPSTADALVDDPTIRRCIGYAKAWGCGGLSVVNLYAYRATDPRALWTVEDPVGPDNDRILRDTISMAAQVDNPIIAAWGANARPERVRDVVDMLPAFARRRLSALGTTKDGQPRHPLYLRADLTPLPWVTP